MTKFYKINETTFAAIADDGVQVTGFTNFYTLGTTASPVNDIIANCAEVPEAQVIYDSVQHRALLESVDGMDFFIDKKTFKIGGCIGNQLLDLDSADAKNTIVGERKRMKDFLKTVKKSKESYKLGDRILLYGPTGTGKTYNFIEFMKASKIEHAIIPVSEGMEDLDLMNYIVPSATGVAYKPKEITHLLERAEKGEKVCIIFDELNRWSNSLMNLVLKALDPVDGINYSIMNVLQDRTYIIPQENIIWGATVNLGGKYTGTNALDEALFDRFNIVSFVGYNPDVEQSLVEAAGFNKAQTKKILQFVNSIRDFATSGELRSPISTRWVKVWMEEYMNNGDLLLSFERTLLYRLISVDEFGAPNPQELDIIKSKFKEALA